MEKLQFRDMKLQSHIDYENSIDTQKLSDADFRNKSKNHRVFLTKQLELGDFVPCDEDGNVLEKVYKNSYKDYYSGKWQMYQQAKDRVIFEGFELVSDTKLTWIFKIKSEFPNVILKYGKVEYLTNRNLTLTPNAIKKYNL